MTRSRASGRSISVRRPGCPRWSLRRRCAAIGAPRSAGQASTSGASARFWSVPAWRLAAAALVLATSGYLLVDDLRVRRRMSGVREAHAELEQRARQLQEEVNRQQSTARATEEELARAREALAAARGRANGEPRPGGQGLLALVFSRPRGMGARSRSWRLPRAPRRSSCACRSSPSISRDTKPPSGTRPAIASSGAADAWQRRPRARNRR